MKKYILIYGNPVDGMRFVGPFDTFDDAEDYTVKHIDDDWWIAELAIPDPKYDLRDASWAVQMDAIKDG